MKRPARSQPPYAAVSPKRSMSAADREALVELWAALFEAELRAIARVTDGTPGGSNRG